jgi:hypothetical protein
MGVNRVWEKAPNRDGEKDRERRGYSRVFGVTTNSRSDDARTVMEASGIPSLGTAFPGDGGAVAVRVRPRQVEQLPDGGGYWEVVVDYDQQQFGGNDPNRPDLDPPEVNWTFGQRTVAAVNDFNGRPIVNAAGDPYDPPLERVEYYPVLSITRNELGYNAAFAAGFIGRMNADAFYGWPPRTVLCTNFSGVLQFNRPVLYWRVSYQFDFANFVEYNTWDPTVLDRGFRAYFQHANGETKAAVLDPATGAPVNEPVPLTATGFVLPTGAAPVYVTHQIHGLANFGVLGLENLLG